MSSAATWTVVRFDFGRKVVHETPPASLRTARQTYRSTLSATLADDPQVMVWPYVALLHDGTVVEAGQLGRAAAHPLGR